MVTMSRLVCHEQILLWSVVPIMVVPLKGNIYEVQGCGHHFETVEFVDVRMDLGLI